MGLGPALLTGVVFLALLVLWCAADALLGSHKKITMVVRNAGQLLLPVVLITIGGWILIDSGVLTRLMPSSGTPLVDTSLRPFGLSV
ncbi:MAG: hypothetical protein ACRDTC_22325 [Pseudonocardiaceae bacterium]